MAIAEAITKRLAAAAAAAAAKAPGKAPVNADSLKQSVQRAVADSIARVNAAAATAAQAFAAAPAPPAAPAVSSAKPKLAIGELRASSEQAALSGFSRALVDALRGSLDKGDAFTVVDQDAVHGAMGRTKTGEEVAKLVDADVMIIPSFAGTGDTVNISVAVRDLRPGSRYGFRVISMKAMPAYPQYYVAPLVQAVLKQVDALPHVENR
jgi:hypothetical protein